MTDALIVVTSASRRSYLFDLLDALAAPRSASVRFVFRRRWFSNVLLRGGKLPEVGYIVFNAEVSDGEGGVRYEFVPLLQIQAIAIEPQQLVSGKNDEDLLSVVCLLDGVMRLDSYEQDALAPWQTWIVDDDGAKQTTGAEQGPVPKSKRLSTVRYNYVFTRPLASQPTLVAREHEAATHAIKESNEAFYWSNLAGKLATYAQFADAAFFRVSGLLRSEAGSPFTNEQRRIDGNPSWRLPSGQPFRVALQIYHNPQNDLRLGDVLVPKSATASLALTAPITSQDGANVNAVIYASSQAQYARDIATLVVGGTDAAGTTLVGRAVLTIELLPPRYTLWIIVGSLIVGSFASSIDDKTAALFHFSESFVLGIKVLGSVLVGVAGYLGFRRLPG